MKKLFITVLFLLISIVGFSQNVYMLSDRSELHVHNEKTKDFDLLSVSDDKSMFEITKNYIYHTTDEMKSAYKVDFSHKNQYGEHEVYVKSDAGNPYVFIIDLSSKEIRIFGEIEDVGFALVYHIKEAW